MRNRHTRSGAGLAIVAAVWVAGCSRVDGAQRQGGPDGPGRFDEPDHVDVAAPGRLADSTLARLVSEILPMVERSAGMTAVAPLKVAATDEGRLRAYLEEQIATQLSTDEAAAITAAYARLGLVPSDLDLPALFLALLEEQVVGYYDPVTDTLFVHERVTVEQLEPVLAHELVHALQDQRVPLDSLGESLKDRNDASTAYQAAIEGHATYAMMEWKFTAMTGVAADLTALPDMGAMFADLDLAALGDVGPVEVLVGAPAIVREGLLFPYVGGLVFLQRMWKARPERPLPFGVNLPQSTEQVLHVDRWLAGDAPTRVDFSESDFGWPVVYERDLGELETRIFLEEHLGDRERAERAAAGWDGDALRLFGGPEGEVLVWVSVWDSPAEADEFAAAAEEAYTHRYASERRAPLVERYEQAGRPLVRIIDLPAGVTLPAGAAAVRLTGGEEETARAGGS